MLAYLTLSIGMVVAANLAKGLVTFELDLFADPDSVPRWIGIAGYVQGVVLLGLVVLLSVERAPRGRRRDDSKHRGAARTCVPGRRSGAASVACRR